MNYAEWAKWYDLFYSTESGDEVEFYLDLMRRAGGPALEIGVGTGRIAIPAANEGLEVFGVDFSREMLAVAEEKARAAAPLPGGLTLVHGDMRRLDLGRKDFALVTIPAHTLLLATTAQEQADTLCCAARHLRPGGVLAFKVFNPTDDLIYDDSDEPILIGEALDPAAGKSFQLTGVNRFDVESQLNRGTQVAEELDMDGNVLRRTELEVTLRYLSLDDTLSLLREARLAAREIFGDFDGSPLTDESEEIIIIAGASG
jgi:SAM-dependent methyltransferase